MIVTVGIYAVTDFNTIRMDGWIGIIALATLGSLPLPVISAQATDCLCDAVTITILIFIAQYAAVSVLFISDSIAIIICTIAKLETGGICAWSIIITVTIENNQTLFQLTKHPLGACHSKSISIGIHIQNNTTIGVQIEIVIVNQLGGWFKANDTYAQMFADNKVLLNMLRDGDVSLLQA